MAVTQSIATQWIYDFSEGSRELRELLGGKGAGIAEMTRVLGPERVPAGFTITTAACVEYMRAGSIAPAGLAEQVDRALTRLEERVGKRLGDPDNPLLVSVRSGARESMPGMLDTVLNLGLNEESVVGLARTAGNERFAWDSYRRLVQMFGNVVRDVPGERLEEEIARIKVQRRVKLDTELDTAALRELTRRFQALYDFPSDPREQLEQAIAAVFDSWMGDRAMAYRRINGIPDDWGTAVNVQQMVYGNAGKTSGSGVAFSRNELTGAPESSGDFLSNAQGEDVVSGVRTPRDLSELRDWMPDAAEQLGEILRSSSVTTRTCRTPSSRSRRGACTCCRPAVPSAPRRPPCASRSTPSRRGCSPRPRRLTRSTSTRSMRSCTRRSIPMLTTKYWHGASRHRPAPRRERSCSPPRRRSTPRPT